MIRTETGTIVASSGDYLFSFLTNLTSIDLTNFDISKVIIMKDMFHGSYTLKTLDISNFNTSNVTDMGYRFCKNMNLKTIYASNSFVTTNITNSTPMLQGCIILVGSNNTMFNFSYKDATYARIDTDTTPRYFTLNRE